MADAFVDNLELFPKGLIFVVLGIVVLLIAKLIQDFLTPYRIGDQLSHKNNVALGLSITGYYFAVIVVFVATLFDPVAVAPDPLEFDNDFWENVLTAFLYAMGGIVVLNLARIVVDRLVLFKFDTAKEIVDQQNVGSGAVEFGVYVAVGLVIAASTAGTGGPAFGEADPSVVETLSRAGAFFVLGMVVLVLYAAFYQITTPFDIHEQIEQGNTAVGVALGGNLIAVALVTFKAVYGDFVGWGESLAGFLTFAVAGFVLLFVVRFVVDIVLLPGTKVSNELAVDRNLGVAFIESAVVISAALVLYFAI